MISDRNDLPGLSCAVVSWWGVVELYGHRANRLERRPQLWDELSRCYSVAHRADKPWIIRARKFVIRNGLTWKSIEHVDWAGRDLRERNYGRQTHQAFAAWLRTYGVTIPPHPYFD